MTFPVVFHPFGFPLHAHVLFEMLAYSLGFQTYLLLRRKRPKESISAEQQLWLLVGCVFGAFFGSKLLAWAESFAEYWVRRDDLVVWLGGKTIVGGIIGGWGGVEIAKKILGIRQRTGDGYVIPLCLAIAIGRIGCFLTGLADHTHGVQTTLPWGVDFGDGIARHPTQLYEMAWLMMMATGFTIAGVGWRRDTAGQAFRLFIAGYLLFRFAVEFIKPSSKGYAGLSAIQWASIVVAGVAVWQMMRASKAQPANPSLLTADAHA
ncbi:MAG: prolipoprotein diacylglyceryl transferase [Tepidisphaeraceae bacterium]